MNYKLRSSINDCLIPFIAMLGATAIWVYLFKFFRVMNPTVFQMVVENAGEETNATYGQLMYTMLSFTLCILITCISDKILISKGPQKLMLPWLLSASAGTCLWQCLGESSWHFGINIINDEGASEFINFTRIESVQGIPFLIVFVILYFVMKGKVSFAVQACLGAFIANWYGHVCLIGTYPIAVALGCNVDMVTWYRISGIVNGIIFFALGIGIMLSNKPKKDKYLSSYYLFISCGVLLCGTILGMT